jgi:hypothetical protein
MVDILQVSEIRRANSRNGEKSVGRADCRRIDTP